MTAREGNGGFYGRSRVCGGASRSAWKEAVRCRRWTGEEDDARSLQEQPLTPALTRTGSTRTVSTSTTRSSLSSESTLHCSLYTWPVLIPAPNTRPSDETPESTGSPTRSTSTERPEVSPPRERRTGVSARDPSSTTPRPVLPGGSTTRECRLPTQRAVDSRWQKRRVALTVASRSDDTDKRLVCARPVSRMLGELAGLVRLWIGLRVWVRG